MLAAPCLRVSVTRVSDPHPRPRQARALFAKSGAREGRKPAPGTAATTCHFKQIQPDPRLISYAGMRLRHFGHSDVGLQRAHNEDAYLADPSLGLFVVCDGVGGRARGEVASSQTVDFIWEWVKREERRIREAAQSVDPKVVQELCGIVRSAVQNATYMLHSIGELDPDHRGMSTTASVLLVAGSIAVIGQVGDSRVYLARNGQVSQLTEDHTLINFQLKHGLITPEQAKHSKQKNVITRAVGHKDYVEVDTVPTPVFPGDRLLLCSDGLHGYLDEADGDELATFIQKDVQEAVLESIRFANEAGGKDNITALLVEFLA